MIVYIRYNWCSVSVRSRVTTSSYRSIRYTYIYIYAYMCTCVGTYMYFDMYIHTPILQSYDRLCEYYNVPNYICIYTCEAARVAYRQAIPIYTSYYIHCVILRYYCHSGIHRFRRQTTALIKRVERCTCRGSPY